MAAGEWTPCSHFVFHCLTACQLLDTTVGTTAEHVYPKLGFKRFGVVPNYGFSPEDGKLRDEVFFFKHLCEPRTIAKQPANSRKPPEAVSSVRYAAFE